MGSGEIVKVKTIILSMVGREGGVIGKSCADHFNYAHWNRALHVFFSFTTVIRQSNTEVLPDHVVSKNDLLKLKNWIIRLKVD